MAVEIRSSRAGDGERLREIERLAGEQFRTVGLASVADDEPASVDELAGYAAAGRGWVVVDGTDEPVAYVIVDIVDGAAHIEQISVRPDHQGLGIGGALIDQVGQWAHETGCSALTLTTFVDVAWNGPLYAHLGFVVIPEAEIGPQLRAVQAAEVAHGLDPSRRVCMRLDLPGSTDTAG